MVEVTEGLRERRLSESREILTREDSFAVSRLDLVRRQSES